MQLGQQLHGQRAAARNFGRARALPRVAAPLKAAQQKQQSLQRLHAVGDDVRADRVSLSMDYGELFDDTAECPLGAVEGASLGGGGSRAADT